MKEFIKAGFHLFMGKGGKYVKRDKTPSGKPAKGRNGETISFQPFKKKI